MPHLFTHLNNHNGPLRDEQGRSYPTEDQAVIEAARTAGSVLTEDLTAGRTPTDIVLHVEREDGSRVATIAVTATIDRATG